MTPHRTSIRRRLYRLRTRMLSLATCVWLFQTLATPALIGTALMAVAPAARANCTYSGTSSNTYTYTAANIAAAAPLDLQGTWACYNGSTTASSSQYICYMATFGSPAPGSNGGTLAYSVRLYKNNSGSNNANTNVATNSNSTTAATSGTWYRNPLYSTPDPNITKLEFNVAANAASTATTAGTYTASSTLHIDEQANSGSCEGNSGGGWDSASTALTGYYVVPSFCALGTTSATLDFGNLNVGPLAAERNATTTLTVKCNNQATYTVYLGDGGYRLGAGARQMANGTARLAYQLYKDSGHQTIWDATGIGSGTINGSGGVTETGSGGNQNLTVYGRIAQGTNVPATIGNYSDTVVITVAY